MATPANWGKLVNLESALRKSSLIPFGLFSPDDNMAFLAGPGSSNGESDVVTEIPTETPDGVIITFTFTSPPQYLIWNGQWLMPTTDFAVSGNTAIMPVPPNTGDRLLGVL